MLRYAYNTNGTAHHRLDDAIALLADEGYQGVALTLDHQHLDPFAPDLAARTRALGTELGRRGLGSVIETGARYLLDPRAKHEPTLVSPEVEGRARRVDFLCRAVDVAADLGSEAVSFWAGVPRAGVDRRAAWEHLVAGVQRVVAHAERRGVTMAFEPEPGMLVETVDDYRRLAQAAPGLRLALDTGHCLVTGDRLPEAAVRETSRELATVAVEDMKRGVHEHLPFGEGEVDLEAVLGALLEVRFERLVCVELSRDSHRAHTMVRTAREHLREAEARATRSPGAAREGVVS